MLAPGMMNDARFKQWWATYLRRSASPADALALAQMNTQVDIRNILHAIHTPTLILHRTGDMDSDVRGSRYMSEQIAGAKFVELHGNDHIPWVGDSQKF
jgi:pimeloyl-ACP methyl ester carboxylesterase